MIIITSTAALDLFQALGNRCCTINQCFSLAFQSQFINMHQSFCGFMQGCLRRSYRRLKPWRIPASLQCVVVDQYLSITLLHHQYNAAYCYHGSSVIEVGFKLHASTLFVSFSEHDASYPLDGRPLCSVMALFPAPFTSVFTSPENWRNKCSLFPQRGTLYAVSVSPEVMLTGKLLKRS